MNRLPVTLIGGFLGAGKTSLLHHLISEHRGGHLAVLVENPGPLNLDAKAIRGLCGAMRRTNDAVFEIPDGDASAQISAIGNCLRDLARAGRYERVLIELAGTSSPAWLARNFDAFAEFAELQQIICVVDALDYFRAGSAAATEPAHWAFLNEQISASTLAVLNKSDLIAEEDLRRCRGSIYKIHPMVQLFLTEYGEVPPEHLLKTFSTREIAATVERQPEPEARNATDEDLSSALYRTHRPFHPQRFWDWFDADHPGLLRVKGIIWLATRNLLVGGVSRTRWQNSCGAAGIWWAALPREEWPQDPGSLSLMQETWREPYGDRRQELVLIGDALLLATTTRKELDACLLTDEEFARPVEEWASFPDPFPVWDLEEG